MTVWPVQHAKARFKSLCAREGRQVVSRRGCEAAVLVPIDEWRRLQDVSDADLHLASVTIGEIQAGIELTRDQDPAKAAEIKQRLVQVTCTYNILAMDGAAFRCCTRLINPFTARGREA